MKRFDVVLCGCLVVLGVLLCSFYAFLQPPSPTGKADLSLEDMTVWAVGDCWGCSFVDDAISFGVDVKNLTLDEFNADASVKSQVLSPVSLVLFDSEFLECQRGSVELHSFLNETVYGAAGVLVVGNQTSMLYAVLDDANIYYLSADDRNPASGNPPIAGFRLRVATNPDGGTYHYPSIYLGASDETSSLLEGVNSWTTS